MGVRWLVRDDQGDISSAWLARSASVDRRWGGFLRDLVEVTAASSVLELGTCVGISGAYMSSASQRPSLTTLDASVDLASIAQHTLGVVTDRASVVVGPFDETLAEVLDGTPFDLAFIDGHHDGAATEAYVRAVLRSPAPPDIVVVDDIRLHRDMWASWQRMASSDDVSSSVDVGRFGLLQRCVSGPSKLHFDLSRHAGSWSRLRLRAPSGRGGTGLFGSIASTGETRR
jgi:predicted O-methyltransferase YrrM